MKKFLMRLLKLFCGIFLYALGIVIAIKANIGYAPWDVFHVGLANIIGVSIGMASIMVGIVIVVITALLGEKLGLGTISNMIFIGVFVDIILALGIIPVASSFTVGIIMLILGLYSIALGSYFYIGSAFGAGPRDSLMVALTRKTGLPVGVCRGMIELIVALVGWKLGGMLGIGTAISALAIGFCVQTTFKLLKFDPTQIKHGTLNETFKSLISEKSVSAD